MMLLKNMQKYQNLARYSFSTATCYYNVLGVSSSASQSEILNAYSNLAAKQFPRVFTGEGVADSQISEQYRNIAEAYAVLSNLESRNNYDLLNKRQPERILKENRDQQLKDQQRDHTGHVKKPDYPKGSYAEERRQVLAEERAKFNVNFLGRYKGGLPQKGKGPIRASVDGVALGPPGGHHDILAHTEKTEIFPDHQNVTNEMAQDFAEYQNQSRYQDTRRWPAFQAKVDYDYFKFDHYRMGLRYFRNILIFFFGIPGFAVLFAKWRNYFSLRTFKSIKAANSEAPVESFGRKVIVGKHGAIKYA